MTYKTIKLQFAQAEQPIYKEVKGKGYVEYGEKNNYPDYLLALFNESPKHGAIVKNKAKYIYGKGFENGSFSVNKYGETANQLFKKCIIDDELFGGYYLQVVYNAAGQISDIYHMPFKKVRVSDDKTKFYVKDDWSSLKEKPRVYDAFNPNAERKITQIIFIEQYSPDCRFYPTPQYFQGLNYIESDVQISRHILGNAKNGWKASKLVNLNNGMPQEEEQEQVEKDIKKKFTGSEGEGFVLMFNPSKENGAEILDLGQTSLTKEDFTNVNNLIQQEIFAAHQVTSPMLFGIKTEGQLGGATELEISYAIFNNTYINERQQEFEQVFAKIFSLKGVNIEAKILPVEPVGMKFSEAVISANMTRAEIRERLGLPPEEGVAETPTAPTDVNTNLANMTGRQFQQLERIKRKYKAGAISKDEASLMLKSSFGLKDEDVNILLGIDSDPSTDDEMQTFSEDDDLRLLQAFDEIFEEKDQYEILSSTPAREVNYFNQVSSLTSVEANVLDLISKDKRIDVPTLASTLKVDTKVVEAVLKSLVDNKLLSISTSGEKNLLKPMEEIRKLGKVTTTEILLRYTYVGPKDDRNRPFCAKMLELAENKLWSRAQIELISERIGYSVWDRRGGWFTMRNGEHRPYCRHRWEAVIVTRKK